MSETDIYPVGLLSDIKRERVRYGLRHYLLRQAKDRNWRAVRNYFNGYLAEHRHGGHNAGKGWTKRAAARRVERICEAALDASSAPVSTSQDHDWHQPLTHCRCGRVIPCRHHDGAEGQSEGEKPADRRCPTCGIPFAHYTHDPQGRPL